MTPVPCFLLFIVFTNKFLLNEPNLFLQMNYIGIINFNAFTVAPSKIDEMVKKRTVPLGLIEKLSINNTDKYYAEYC